MMLVSSFRAERSGDPESKKYSRLRGNDKGRDNEAHYQTMVR